MNDSTNLCLLLRPFRSCETTKIKREKQRMDVELAALNSHMNDVIKRKYQNGLVRQLVVRYLRNVMMVRCLFFVSN